MGAKLSFSDIVNKEIDPGKLIFTGSSESSAVSVGSGAPSGDAVIGALYLDTANNNLYIKQVAGAAAANWTQITSGSLTANVSNLTYRILTDSSVTATGSSAPVIGDLIGIWGSGAWTTGANLSASNAQSAMFGSGFSAINVGGPGAAPAGRGSLLFNGSAWSASGNASHSRTFSAGTGSSNSGLVAGGWNQATGIFSSSELFNGSAWSLSGSLSQAKQAAGSAGSYASCVLMGGAANSSYTTGTVSVSEQFNGAIWTVGANSVFSPSVFGSFGGGNSAVKAGGFDGNRFSVTELFNGSVWTVSGNIAVSTSFLVGFGSMLSGIVCGGTNNNPNVLSTTQMFNGSAWLSGSENLNLQRQQHSGEGGQANGLVAGGLFGVTFATTNNTELRSQTIYRKLYSKYLPSAKGIGILTSTNTVQLLGNVSLSGYYPANKYIILNRNMVAQPGNETDLSGGLALQSIQGSAPYLTYNFTTTNVQTVVPGMIAYVVSGGANPISGNNAGAFVISKVVPNSSIELVNSGGLAQNPGTGTIYILNSLMAVNNITSQDILIGKTDSSGLLRISNPIISSNTYQRIK